MFHDSPSSGTEWYKLHHFRFCERNTTGHGIQQATHVSGRSNRLHKLTADHERNSHPISQNNVAAVSTSICHVTAKPSQVLALSVYGVLLAVLFLAFQAPDVTLSELTVGAVALPAVLLLTLAKIKKREE